MKSYLLVTVSLFFCFHSCIAFASSPFRCPDSWTDIILDFSSRDISEVGESCTESVCYSYQSHQPEGCMVVCAPGGATFLDGEECIFPDGQPYTTTCGSVTYTDGWSCEFCVYSYTDSEGNPVTDWTEDCTAPDEAGRGLSSSRVSGQSSSATRLR